MILIRYECPKIREVILIFIDQASVKFESFKLYCSIGLKAAMPILVKCIHNLRAYYNTQVGLYSDCTVGLIGVL